MIDAHRGAFEYDWRARFPGVKGGVEAVGRSMPWGEAFRLAQILAADPSSHVAAALLEWDHPISREDMVLRDLYDLTVAAHKTAKRKAPPYPRPWKLTTARTKPGKQLSQADVIAALRYAGHTAPLPRGLQEAS